ncbi:hypothetical protein D6851_14325 [Altericroceibacterium spongiae]|uniref:Peptidoglycan-binding protein n=2 Tax=Altericroceibacterium spongiae TaxID=2320269 RepID=A0A420EE67_9SPHN|nr:hypothetical protein D6851_14325 [Altericroceibacterium spongiae]
MDLDLWPGFVDALASMLLVLIFVLSMFAMMQSTSSHMPASARATDLAALDDKPPEAEPEIQAQPLREQPEASPEKEAWQKERNTQQALVEQLRDSMAETQENLAETRKDLQDTQSDLARAENEREAYKQAASSSRTELARLQKNLAQLQQASAKIEKSDDKPGKKGLGNDFTVGINVGSGH